MKFLNKVEASPKMDILKKNKVPLTDEERDLVMERKATWNEGKEGAPSPAVWKSKVKDQTWYVTNTRAFQAKKTIKSAIKIFHDFIKGTTKVLVGLQVRIRVTK